jgi:hypothetical protein
MTDVAVRSLPREGWAEPPTFIVAGTGIALAVSVGTLSYVHPPLAWLGMSVLVLAAGAVFVRTLEWRAGLMVLLIVTCLIDRYTFSVGRLNIRPEHIAVALLLAATVLDRVRSGRLDAFKPRLGEAFLVAWFVVAAASSVLEAPHRSDSVKVLALLAISSLALFLPSRVIEKDQDVLDRVLRWLLLAFAIDSAYAVGAYFLHLFGPTISISVNPAGGHFNAYGTLWEPNVLGAISGAGALAWAHLGKDRFRHHWIGIALCFSACVVSLARAALLAVVVVYVLSFVLPPGRRPNIRASLYAIATALVTMAALILADVAGKYTIQPGGAINSLGNGTDLIGRLNQFRPVFADLKANPILGLGIDSFGQRHVTQGLAEHLANVELLLLNDTGILGLLLVLGFIAMLAIAAWLRRHDAMVVGLTATALVVFITNQATETLELMITWLLLGLVSAAIYAAPNPVPPPGSARRARDTGT